MGRSERTGDLWRSFKIRFCTSTPRFCSNPLMAGVPVLSGEHGRIKHAASTRRAGSHRGSLQRPGCRSVASDPRRHAPGAAGLHRCRSGRPTCLGQRSGPRSRFHGADDGAVQPPPHQPQRPTSVCPAQRSVHLSHERGRSLQAALRSPSALADGVDLDRSGTHPKPRVGSRGLAVGFHAGTRHLQQRRQSIHSAPQPDGAAVQRQCPVDLRGQAR